MAAGRPGLNLTSPTRIPASAWGPDAAEEGTVLIVDNYVMHGVIERSQYGASPFGLVHVSARSPPSLPPSPLVRRGSGVTLKP